MTVVEETPNRLQLTFQEEPASQLLLGIVLVVAAILALLVFLAEPSTGNGGWLVLTLAASGYAFLERTCYGCSIDRSSGQFTLLERNALGFGHRRTCRIRDIRRIEVRRRVSGRGRPCSAIVQLKSGRQWRLLSYQSCDDQRRIVERLQRFCGTDAR